MSDNDEENETKEEDTSDPVVDKVEETLDSSKTLTMDHLNEMKSQLDHRMDALSRDKTKDDEEKSQLRGQIDTLTDQIKELKTMLEDKSKDAGGETMLIAPEELNPKQQNDGVEEDHTGNAPQQRATRKGWKRWV